MRIADLSRAWLRDVCKAVESGGELSASELADVCILNGLAIPSCREDADDRGRAKAVGMTMARLFKDVRVMIFDGVEIARKERSVKRDDGEGYTCLKTYRFRKEGVAAVTAPTQG